MMQIFDAHAHLQSQLFDHDRPAVLQRAHAAGVEYILNAATEPSDWDTVRNLAKEEKSCLAALGIHPWYIPENAEHFLTTLSDSDFLGVSAVGEIGLDAVTAPVPLNLQTAVFEAQLALAGELHLPCIIHCRGASGELIRSAKKTGIPYGAIIHAFNGTEELAAEFIRHGFLLSFGGALTFPDKGKRAKALRQAWPESFLIETDSPDIPAAGRKGERNEPALILDVITAAASLLGETEETVARIAFGNARRLFNP
jgi:TatD DNase family protein